MILSIMDMNEHQPMTATEEIPATAPQASPENAAAGDGGAGGSTEMGATPLDPSCGNCAGRLPRQLLRNLWSGARIALLLPVAPDRLCATAGNLALLAGVDFTLNLAVSLLMVGRGGSFAYSAVSSFFFHLPLMLFFGFAAARVLSRPSLVVAIPVALVAASLPIELCHSVLERVLQTWQLGWLQDYLYASHYYRFFSWWIAAALVFLLRLKPAAAARTAALWLLFAVLVALPLWLFPRGDLWVGASENAESGQLHLTDEVLAAQQRLLDAELNSLLPGRRGIADLYFVGFAGDGTQDVFLKELNAAKRLFEQRFGALGRTLLLANNPQTAVTLPFATAGNLERALSGVGRVMNRDQDVLFLYLTSHGSREHELAVNNPPLELDELTPEMLRRMLQKSGIHWKVLVVSACYAGGFIEPLKDDHTLIITAADPSHESFGCGFGEKFTWFGEAFLDDALRRTFSFTEAFKEARGTIEQWELEQGETPSNPQIWVGEAIRPKLAELERRLAKESRQ